MVPRKERPQKATRPYVKQPEREPVTLQHAVEEGILIARSALTMEVKNHIIVSTLRDDQRFDVAVTAGFVAHELGDLATEQAEYATRMDRAAAAALTARGSARHQHDYHSLDHPALTRRSEIYRSLAAKLQRLATDDEFIAAVVNAAREQAWGEISTAIQARLNTVYSAEADADSIAGDVDYVRDRDERIAVFLAMDLAGLVPVARPRRLLAR